MKITDKITITNEDCLKEMKSISNESIDAIITDPPYGTTACKWDSVIPFDLMWEQLNRIIKPNGAIVLFGKQPFTSSLINSNIKSFKENLVWIKHKPTNFANAKYMHLNYIEDIIIFSKGKTTFNRQMQKRKSDRIKQAQKGSSKSWRSKPKKENEVAFSTDYEPREWNIYDSELKNPMNYLELPSVVSNSLEKVNHPTQKPVALMEYLIKTYTNENDTVLDFTMGSGSTGVACVNTNRNFIGIEKDKKYFEIAEQRIKNHISQQKLFL